MKNLSRFIPGEEIADVAQWRFGAVDRGSQHLSSTTTSKKSATDLAQLEAFRNEAYLEGVAQGQAMSKLDLQRQMETFLKNQKSTQAESFTKLFESTEKQLQAAEQDIAAGVLALSCELAKTVIRREIAVDKQVLLPVIHEALGILIEDGKSARVRLNPVDLASLKSTLEVEFPTFELKLLPDDAIAQGGCVVESAGTIIDATTEKRWSRTVATLGLDIAWRPSAND